MKNLFCLLSSFFALLLVSCSPPPQLEDKFSLEVQRKRIFLVARRDHFIYINEGASIHNVRMQITYMETEGNFGTKGEKRIREESFDEWKTNERKIITPADTTIDRIKKIIIEIKAKEGVLKKEFGGEGGFYITR